MSTEHSLKEEINISKFCSFLSFCCAVVLANNILVLNLSLVLSAVQRGTESYAARHSVHTPQSETHAATTLQNL